METKPATVSPRIFDVYYADSRTSVVMEADLDHGWEKLEKTYGFFRQTRIPYKNDLNIRAQLQVIAQPGSFGPWAQEFPNAQLSSDDPLFSYSLISKRLKVKISLSIDQDWRTTPQGRPEIYLTYEPLLKRDDGRWYDLRAWLVFHESGMRPVRDVRVWLENKLLVAGGQIESNRRRH